MMAGRFKPTKAASSSSSGSKQGGPVTPSETTPMNVNLPLLPEGIDIKEYWVLQVQGTAWYMVMMQIAKTRDVQKHEKDLPAIALMRPDGTPFYLFKKNFYPIGVLMQKLGLSEEYIRTHPVISLVETTKPDLPNPSVDYWGSA